MIFRFLRRLPGVALLLGIASGVWAQPFRFPTENHALLEAGGEARFFQGTSGKKDAAGRTRGDGVKADDLVERVKAVLRRGQPKDGAAPKEVDTAKVLERGLLRMDPERHTCTWKGEPVTLTVTEFLILQALASRPGVVKSRNALMDAAYDDQVYVDDRTIDSHIKRLRKKFKVTDDDFDPVSREPNYKQCAVRVERAH